MNAKYGMCDASYVKASVSFSLFVVYNLPNVLRGKMFRKFDLSVDLGNLKIRPIPNIVQTGSLLV